MLDIRFATQGISGKVVELAAQHWSDVGVQTTFKEVTPDEYRSAQSSNQLDVGAWVKGLPQMITDAVRTVPTIPLFMALAAFVPTEWSAETRFFFISIILGLVGWPTLARRIRTHLLTERNQEYVLAAQLCGASPGHVIRRHLLPSFTSYIIVDLVISFPYMVLSETALSFIGLGLKEPVNSLGVLLQAVTNADVLLNYQWHFIPALFFIALVLAFVFVGDGLRDAADPYSDQHR